MPTSPSIVVGFGGRGSRGDGSKHGVRVGVAVGPGADVAVEVDARVAAAVRVGEIVAPD